jgi:hypothetical protein
VLARRIVGTWKDPPSRTPAGGGVRSGRRYRSGVSDGSPDPSFGPSGYLPERAAKRARKIVLRAPLGVQWIVASVLAGVVVVVAGVLFLQRSGDPPPAPWQPVGTLEEVAPTQVVADLEALVVAAGGRVRAFADADEVRYCAESNRLEASDGRVWNLTGRGFGGTDSLAEHPTHVQDGVVYVDPTRTVPGPPPSTDPAEPACS